jgi:xylan 1,4-beta-xylosidase
MPTVRNPILRGFNPDPSICRVGREYFVATSTFEWFPAVRLHGSRDLAHWETAGHALAGPDQLDLRGVPDSGGVWAPSLTNVDGEFWLAYSVVRSMGGDDKDVDNYLVTAPSIEGPWSEPIPLGSRGFDFSFFHDDDGSHWLVGVQWDQRPEHPSFSGIVLEQYDHEQRRVLPGATVIAARETLTEGPNLYHRDGWYHLLVAEGGTGWNHGIAHARSRSITGPYEFDTRGSLLTTRHAPGHPLQKAGHGELVETPGGEWLLVHLASRPVLALGDRYCTLGRETCIQRVAWDDDGWLRLAGGGVLPEVEVEVPDDAGAAIPLGAAALAHRPAWSPDGIDALRFSTLRSPLGPDVADVTSRPGWLRLCGGHSVASVFSQSMLAERVTEHRMVAATVVDAEPASVRQAAGLISWYDREGFAWAQVTWDREHGRHVRLVTRDAGKTERSRPFTELAPGPVSLRMRLDHELLVAEVQDASGAWRAIADPFPAWKLSDDHGEWLRFTGMFLGVRADDLDGSGWTADFEGFDLRVPADDAHPASREAGR